MIAQQCLAYQFTGHNRSDEYVSVSIPNLHFESMMREHYIITKYRLLSA